MLIKFTDSYDNYLYEGRKLVGRIIDHIACQEPFVGGSVELDRFYALSIAISAIIDHLEYDDNQTPKCNEYLLDILKELLTKNLCNTNNQLPDRIINTLPEPVDLNTLKKPFKVNVFVPLVPSRPTF